MWLKFKTASEGFAAILLLGAAASALAGTPSPVKSGGQRVRDADVPADGSVAPTDGSNTPSPDLGTGTDPSAAPIPGTPATSADPTAAQTTAAQNFDASAWRGDGLERVKWLYRVYVGRKPSIDEVEAFVQMALTPASADQTMQKLIAQSGAGGLADNFQATFEKRVDGFVHGTQAAAMGGGDRGSASFGLDDESVLTPGGDLTAMLTPLVQTATDEAPKCGDAQSTAGCFGAWLADWIQPGSAGTNPAPQGTTYLAVLQAIAATF